MPALAASQEMQERAAALGYDWPTVDGIVAKVHEELAELAGRGRPGRAGRGGRRPAAGRRQPRPAPRASRPRRALRGANDKFRRRFGAVERLAAERGVALRDLDFDALDALWDAAKDEERPPRPPAGPARHEGAAR